MNFKKALNQMRSSPAPQLDMHLLQCVIFVCLPELKDTADLKHLFYTQVCMDLDM